MGDKRETKINEKTAILAEITEDSIMSIKIKIGQVFSDTSLETMEGTIIPTLDNEEFDSINASELGSEMPILPMRNVVLFPGTVIPITLGREKAKLLVKDMEHSSRMLVATLQRNLDVNDPNVEDLCDVGTLAEILKVISLPNGDTVALLQGRDRMKIGAQVSNDKYLIANVSHYPETKVAEMDVEQYKALVSTMKDVTLKIFGTQDEAAKEALMFINNNEHKTSVLVNFIALNMDFTTLEKQYFLEANTLYERAQRMIDPLMQKLKFAQLKHDIQSKTQQDINQQQREYMLHQQMRTIQNELGNGLEQEIEELRERAVDMKWSEEMAATFETEVEKLERLNPSGPEYSTQYNYLDTLLSLPWGIFSDDNLDLKKAEKRLNADHYGLDKVKERIIEHLAVLKLKGDLKSPILCLYGPPGVGKTSLGKSVADSLGRKYVRMSLGGVHDESEIRGHRRTYIGAMPGRIIQNIKKAGTSNPVFILDEIDKLNSDYHGDPASALLEVLDPEQNTAFHDNYLNVDYDLSNVLFIATANNIGSIPTPLLDRMEMIDVSGYILEEKVEIAQRHLFPKQLANHGLQKNSFTLPKRSMVYLIEKYTRESGVRQLDKTLATVCRKMALLIAKGDETPKSLAPADLEKMLGVSHYDRDMWSDDMIPGVVTGLAWTSVGGEILFVETSVSKGKGKLTLTGNLGDVMKESAVLALEYVKGNADKWGLQDLDFDELSFHIHVPEGAIPKDGPSAGITMMTSIMSALTQRKVKKRFAMTGEITLRGKVLPVGGIKEKILAAKRSGITDIILSDDNRKDVADIKEVYVNGLTFHYVKYMSEVLDISLEPKK